MNADNESLPVINYEQALENAAGEREIFDAVADAAAQEIPSLYPQLAKAIQGNDFLEGQRLAHTIKGAARVIAAERTMVLAQRIEHAMSEEDRDAAEENLVGLQLAIQELVAELSK
jgi:HPt (histidine-containing phosphotransfer) domain-containing protein